MKKSFLHRAVSVFLCVSLFASTVLAKPAATENADSAEEANNNLTFESAELTSKDGLHFPAAPKDTAIEQNTVFGEPEFPDDSFLFTELQGDGTAQSPFLITSADDLKQMAINVNQGISNAAYYRLEKDIDLGGEEWTPIGYYSEAQYATAFRGVFDGNGHKISGLKITKSDTAHIGFFGHVHEATIKNLTLDRVTVDIDSTNNERLYVGILAGRVVTTSRGSTANISNIKVTNSTLDVLSCGTVYAGGLIGSVISGKNTGDVTVSLSSADCSVSISSTPTTQGHTAVGGGLLGYLGSEEGASVRAFTCSASGSVYADVKQTGLISPIVGGAVGLVMTAGNGTTAGKTTVFEVYSTGNVEAHSQLAYIAGGFAGQITANAKTNVHDCYTTSNVGGECTLKEIYQTFDSAAGGFVGITSYPTFVTGTSSESIHNCFAKGNVKDLTHTSESSAETSFVGGFSGYSDYLIFENCYKFTSQSVVGSDVFYDALPVLDEVAAKKPDSYKTYDFSNVWTMDASGNAILREKTFFVRFMNGTEVFCDITFFGSTVTPPEENPVKDASVDKNYVFSHWSQTANGVAFDFSQNVTSNTTLYAVFSSDSRMYAVNFISNGEPFVPEVSLSYGTVITPPSATPQKPDNGRYSYTFSHWAVEEDGYPIVFNNFTVSAPITFYAVFNQNDSSAWDGSVADSFASGLGTKEMPYVIETSAQFALFAKVINDGDAAYSSAYFSLGDDINLGGNIWTPIGTDAHPYSASFDGCGYIVSGYRINGGKYMGLFGNVRNGNIKNIHLMDFVIDAAINDASGEFVAYAGGLAGYIDSVRADSTISGIRVEAEKFTVSGNAKYVYAGSIAGFATGHSGGHTNILDSFATSSITGETVTGQSFVGGIVGRLNTESASICTIRNCYNTGTVTASSKGSCYAGGLVGYLYSYGSMYAPPVEVEGELNADIDVMIYDSFAIANVNCYTVGVGTNKAYIGRLCGFVSPYADADNIWYVSTTALNSTPGKTKVCNGGYAANAENFKDIEFMKTEMKFNFDTVWTYLGSAEYPVHKFLSADKPILRIVSAEATDSGVAAMIRVFSNETNFDVIITVYNVRNQMVKFERISYTAMSSADELMLDYSGIKNASYISVSAISSAANPLFKTQTAYFN